MDFHECSHPIRGLTEGLSEVNTALETDIAERRKVEVALETVNQKLNLLSQITRNGSLPRVFAGTRTLVSS
jgi:hypothetical protein